MHLREMHKRMANALFTPLDQELPAHAEEFIVSTAKLDAHARLEIYRQSYWYRIIDAFYDDFPGLLSLLGHSAFDILTRSYLADHPSRSFTLRNLGQFLETWLISKPETVGNQYAICLDMVRLEWAHIEAFDSAERVVITLEELTEAGAGSQFALQPHISLLKLQFPVDQVRLDRERAVDAQDYEGGTIYVAVYRHNLSVYYMRLSKEEHTLLGRLKQGETLDAAIEETFLDSALTADEQAKMLKESFGTWGRLGWFCGREKC